MIGLDKIVNLLNYPLVDSKNFIQKCKETLAKKSVLQLIIF